jgi:predicted NodU family carbamoyl transferase
MYIVFENSKRDIFFSNTFYIREYHAYDTNDHPYIFIVLLIAIFYIHRYTDMHVVIKYTARAIFRTQIQQVNIGNILNNIVDTWGQNTNIYNCCMLGGVRKNCIVSFKLCFQFIYALIC